MQGIRSRLSDIIEGEADYSFFMAFEGLHQFTFLHVPQLDCHISAAGNQVGRVTGELTVPDPFQMTFEGLKFRDLEFAAFHVGLEQAYLLVRRAGGQILIVGGELHFQDVVFVSSDEFLVGLRHMLPIAAEKSFVVYYCHSFESTAHCYRPYAVINLYLHHFLSIAQVPPFHHSYIIASDDRSLVGVEGSAVDRFIMLEAFHCCASSEVKQAKVSVLATGIDEIFLLPKTPDCSHITLKVSLIGAQLLLWAFEIIDLSTIVHADNDLAFIFCDFYAVGG